MAVELILYDKLKRKDVLLIFCFWKERLFLKLRVNVIMLVR